MKWFNTSVAILLTTAPVAFALPAQPLKTTRTQPAHTNSRTSHSTTRTSSSTTSSNKRGGATTNNTHEESVLARVTVYWARGGKGSDRYTRKHQSAVGQRLRTGHCAVDPQKIPYGSKVVLPTGETLAAVDTGTAVKNRKAARKSGKTTQEKNALVVDRFFENKKQALAWAKTHPLFMPVRVVKPGAAATTPTPVLAQVNQKITVRKAQAVAPNEKVMIVRKAQPGHAASKPESMLLASNQSASNDTPGKPSKRVVRR